MSQRLVGEIRTGNRKTYRVNAPTPCKVEHSVIFHEFILLRESSAVISSQLPEIQEHTAPIQRVRAMRPA